MAFVAAAVAVAALIAGVVSSSQQSSAAKSIANNNLAAQQHAQEVSQMQNNEKMSLAKAGTSTPDGDTVYLSGAGGGAGTWISTLKPQAKLIDDLGKNEAIQNLRIDAPAQRLQREATLNRATTAGALADQKLAVLRYDNPRSLEAARGALTLSGVAHNQDPLDAVNSSVMGQGLRTGAIGPGTAAASALGALKTAGIGGTNSAIADARLNAPGQFEQDAAAHDNRNYGEFTRLNQTASDTSGFAPIGGTGGFSAAQALAGLNTRNNAPFGITPQGVPNYNVGASLDANNKGDGYAAGLAGLLSIMKGLKTPSGVEGAGASSYGSIGGAQNYGYAPIGDNSGSNTGDSALYSALMKNNTASNTRMPSEGTF